jgi:hypothetical protein
MRHVLGGVALAALLAAGLPAAAQTNGTQPKTPPAASNQDTPVTPNNEGVSSSPADTRSTTKPGPSGASGMSSSPDQSGSSQLSAAPDEPAAKAKGKHAGKNKSMATAHKRGAAAGDNMAEELNRQELAKLEQGSSPGQGSGSSATPAQPAGGMAPDKGMAPK